MIVVGRRPCLRVVQAQTAEQNVLFLLVGGTTLWQPVVLLRSSGARKSPNVVLTKQKQLVAAVADET